MSNLPLIDIHSRICGIPHTGIPAAFQKIPINLEQKLGKESSAEASASSVFSLFLLTMPFFPVQI